MTCECRHCIRMKRIRELIALLPTSESEELTKYFESLLSSEEDLEYYKAHAFGLFPTASQRFFEIKEAAQKEGLSIANYLQITDVVWTEEAVKEWEKYHESYGLPHI
jgi:lipid A disaccharide synthetase